MGKDEKFLSSSSIDKKPWGGRFTKTLDKDMEEFSSSINVDKNLAYYDINGSRAHIEMLNKQKIISQEEYNILSKGLDIIQKELEEGKFELKAENEDIHMSIEKRLIDLVGPIGGKIHTARSRNDQVLVDLKMYIRDELFIIKGLLLQLLKTILHRAERDLDVIMPGYTHMQVAQPILFSHYLMAYFQMYKRDFNRFADYYKRLNFSPLGAAALAGTNFNIDRDFVAKKLSFLGPTENSVDTVSDRDFIIEFLSNIAISQMHSSRFAEDLIIYSTKEFSFIELPDEFTTGSSIMPQKKNPDLLELIRGKCGSIYGNLISLLTILKGLPLSYNRDLQEDKTQIFDTIYNYKNSIKIIDKIIENVTVNRKRLSEAALDNYSTATDLADYLTMRGTPFREAHNITGKIVLYAIKEKKNLNELALNEFKKFSNKINEDIYEFIDINNSVNRKKSYGGTARASVERQIEKGWKFVNAQNC